MAHVCMLFVSKTSETSNCFILKWLHVQFCGGDIFVMQMMFSVNMLNIKVVYNFLILLFLKFHDFRPSSLGVIDFTSLLSAFSCALNRSE